MIMCLSTKGYCFQEQWAIVLPFVFLLFCNLKILKQGIEMQIFFPKRVVEILKKGVVEIQKKREASPSSYIQVPPPGDEASS